MLIGCPRCEGGMQLHDCSNKQQRQANRLIADVSSSLKCSFDLLHALPCELQCSVNYRAVQCKLQTAVQYELQYSAVIAVCSAQ